MTNSIAQRVTEMVEALRNISRMRISLDKTINIHTLAAAHTIVSALTDSAQLIADIEKMETHFREVTKKEEIKAPEVEMTKEELEKLLYSKPLAHVILKTCRVVRR